MAYAANLDEAIKLVSEEVDKLRKKHASDLATMEKKMEALSGTVAPPKSFETYEPVQAVYKPYNHQSDIEKAFTYSDPEEASKRILGELDAAEKLMEEIAARNKLISEHNTKVRQSIYKIMEHFGIPESKSIRDPKSRARWPKSIKVPAGFVSDLDEYIHTYDRGYSQTKSTLSSIRSSVLKQAAQFQQAAEQKRMAAAVAEAQRLKNIAYAKLRVKHNIEDAAWDSDILYAILKKNKYLHLAHYICKNRGDWTDGYDYAETGLSGFTVETDEDRQIAKCISKIINDYDDVDGRYFRDCEWSYDVLFNKVKESDPELYADYEAYLEYDRGY